MKIRLLLMIPALLFMAGCAHVISQKSQELIDHSITFEKLRAEPDAYVGKYVLLGGAVAGVRNTNEGSWLEVVQLPVSNDGCVKERLNSSGRFMAVTKSFLDPLIYKKGRLVTIVGDVQGEKTMTLDEMDYNYPIIGIREIHLWRTTEYDRYYYNQPPGYYPFYWYDPWWPNWYYPPGPYYW